MTGGGGTVSNITQIASRNHTDLQNFSAFDDHLGYGTAAPSHDVITSWTTGLDAAKTATPAVGAVYIASDTKKQYYCSQTNVWLEKKNVVISATATTGSVVVWDGSKGNTVPPVAAGDILVDNGVGNQPSFQSPAAIINRKFGTASKAVTDATTTQTIAHGLGRIPQIVYLNAQYINTPGTTLYGTSGMSDGTNNQCQLTEFNTSLSGVVNTSNAIELIASFNTGAQQQNGTVTVDATNITIHWTNVGSGGGVNTVTFMWEAE